jgi:tRNA threonylcarbamoyl adenosine modification protein YeaZ
MYSLFLDHSFPSEVISLFENGLVVTELALDRSLGEHPCLAWQKMLAAQGCSLQEIDFFICGTGPGSYTGMRGAAAAVKAVSFVKNKPIVSVSSLLLLCPTADATYLLIKDAKIAGFYGQAVTIQEGEIFCRPPKTISSEEIARSARENIVVLCEESDSAALKIGACPVRLQCAVVARYAFGAFFRNETYRPENLPLAYLRKTQAEIGMGGFECERSV